MHGEFYFGMVTFGLMIWAIGHDLINSFFKRKEEIIIRLFEKERE